MEIMLSILLILSLLINLGLYFGIRYAKERFNFKCDIEEMERFMRYTQVGEYETFIYYKCDSYNPEKIQETWTEYLNNKIKYNLYPVHTSEEIYN